MTVFIVPAANQAAQVNYAKTLTSPVSSQRRRALPSGLFLPEGELYAWGFPRNRKNLALWKQMSSGDICFFYMTMGARADYCWAARVSRVVDDEHAEATSAAFWDTTDFLPYYVDRPIRIQATTSQLADSLAPAGDYMASHPLGCMKLGNEAKAARALAEFGSFDEWAVEFIREHSIDALDGDQIDSYFSVMSPVGAIPKIEYSAILFAPTMKVARGASISGASQSRRISRRAKMIGDAGELAAVEHLRATLPALQAATVRWVASDGQTPGWDIEYLSDCGELVRIEVKSTVGDTFTSFDMTANELFAAKEHGASYHLYLIANCLSPARRRLQIVIDPVSVFDGLFAPSVYRVGYASSK